MAKNKITGIFILLFVIGVGVSFQPPTIEQVYLSQVGVQEVPRGSNWGPQVGRYLKSVKVKVPAAWCAAFVHYGLDSAGHKNSITAWSPTAHNKNNVVYFRRTWFKEMQPGDVFTIYFVSMKRIAHTGFAHRRINSSIIETVEGNSNAGGSREGYMVARRKRPVNTLYSITRW